VLKAGYDTRDRSNTEHNPSASNNIHTRYTISSRRGGNFVILCRTFVRNCPEIERMFTRRSQRIFAWCRGLCLSLRPGRLSPALASYICI